jgi:hypothetical protein
MLNIVKRLFIHNVISNDSEKSCSNDRRRTLHDEQDFSLRSGDSFFSYLVRNDTGS